MPRPVLKPGPDPPAGHGDPGPQAIPLQLGHELGGICRQPGHRSGQHQRDEAWALPRPGMAFAFRAATRRPVGRQKAWRTGIHGPGGRPWAIQD
jgi:hypothetical protein